MLFEDFVRPNQPLLISPFVKTFKESQTDDRIQQVRYISYGVIAPIIIAVGIFGNLLTFLILRLPRFRGVTYTYFLVLAVSDLLSLFFTISLLHHLLHDGTAVYSTAVWYSYFETLCVNAPMSASVLIIVCITVDRFFSVCRPVDFKRIHTDRYARRGITAAILLALIFWLPSCVLKEPLTCDECNSSHFEPPDNRTWWVSCMNEHVRDSKVFIAYAWIRQSLLIFIPSLTLVILNSLIVGEFVRVRRKKKEMAKHQVPKDSPATEIRKREDKHLISLLTAVMISFSITMVPSGIFGAVYNEVLSTEFAFEVFRAVANDLEILNHALNFYLYIFCSKPIRDTIKTFFQEHSCCVYRTSSVSSIIEVVQHANGNSHGQIHPPSSPTAGVVQSVSRRDKDTNSERSKTKTLSRETQPSEIFSESDSSMSEDHDENVFSEENLQNMKYIDEPSDEQCTGDSLDTNENNIYVSVAEMNAKRTSPDKNLEQTNHTVEVHCSEREHEATGGGFINSSFEGDEIMTCETVEKL